MTEPVDSGFAHPGAESGDKTSTSPIVPGTALLIALQEVHDAAGIVLSQSVLNNPGTLGQVLRLDKDLEVWTYALAHRPESTQLENARAELAYAVYAAATGNYRLAYSASRLFLELSFAAVYFSANELHRLRWLADRADFSWSTALDRNEGILAKNFVREFNEDAVEDASIYAGAAAEAYRHFSQFIHGKHAATATLPRSVEYAGEVLADWAAATCRSAESVVYLLYCRYGPEVLTDDDGTLGETLEHTFGHLKSVRLTLGLPVEQE